MRSQAYCSSQCAPMPCRARWPACRRVTAGLFIRPERSRRCGACGILIPAALVWLAETPVHKLLLATNGIWGVD